MLILPAGAQWEGLRLKARGQGRALPGRLGVAEGQFRWLIDTAPQLRSGATAGVDALRRVPNS